MGFLTALARFSKVIAKYEYYPLLIGFIGLGSAIGYHGTFYEALGIFVFSVCAILSLFAALSRWLCKKAGIDPKIR
jgi:hypothetical protein